MRRSRWWEYLFRACAYAMLAAFVGALIYAFSHTHADVSDSDRLQDKRDQFAEICRMLRSDAVLEIDNPGLTAREKEIARIACRNWY